MAKKITKPKIKKFPARIKKVNKMYPLPGTDVGMVGEKELLHPDIKTSNKLFGRFQSKISGFKTAIDIAGGIGRVARQILLPRFKRVDIQDFNSEFLKTA